MSEVICDNYTLIQVLSRFKLPLGFGDGTIKDICDKNNVDCSTFLAVVNFILADNDRMDNGDIDGVSISSLMGYLMQAHDYFLDYLFPSMRTKLINALDDNGENDVSFLILNFFDAYVQQVRKHMQYENDTVFKYVERLQQGIVTTNYSISKFARNHKQIDKSLSELKNIIIRYYPAGKCNNKLNSVLFDIFSCEKDLISHNRVEDFMFVPMVLKLEEST